MKSVRRLYEQFHPEHYLLKINPDKVKMVFQGNVTITGQKTGRPSQRITFHGKDITIQKATIKFHDKKGDKDIEVNRIVKHKNYDEIRLHSNSMIYPGKYTINLEFSGNISKPMNGLYPCFYQSDDQEEIILATQFESHHAREVFPCIDEPEAKAIFDLTLTAPENETVLANTEVATKKKINDLVEVTFKPSPKMSTYLLAFVIGKLDYLEQKTKNGIIVKAFSSPSNKQYCSFALQTAVDCLDFYNDYFSIDYPLNKCDLVALPDFASGAMENWGLITFREQALIVDDQNTSLSMKQYVANVVAHELTHQWFGNLVTMRWWNDLWLNESFATLMSYVAIDKLFPEWKVWNDFIISEQSQALKLDSLEHTHPINVTIKHPDEIRTIFDNISYEKGASVLYMLMKYIGEEYFQAGLQKYLTKHAYSNTESSDLWAAWEEASKKPIAEYMSSWTTQAGYPIIKVENKDDQIRISQKRFYLNPKANKESANWSIVLFSNINLDKDTINKPEELLNYGSKIDHPLILNHNHQAFYRTVYDDNNIIKLVEAIKANDISELDRQGILSDSIEAAKAGNLPTVSALKLLQAYSNEDKLGVWEVIASALGSIRGVMDDEELRELMNPRIAKLIETQYNRLGFKAIKNETIFDQLLRPLILGLATTSEIQDAVKQCFKLFNNREKNPINPDIRGVVYTTVARNGDEEIFNQLLKMHNLSNNSEERITIAAGLTNFKQTKLINLALSNITGKNIRIQDAAYWISYSFSNRFAKNITWEWIKSHWDWLEKNLGNDLSFYMMPRYVAKAYSDDKFIPEFKSFFEQNISNNLIRPLNQAIETITWQSEWKKRDLKIIKDYFKSNNH